MKALKALLISFSLVLVSVSSALADETEKAIENSAAGPTYRALKKYFPKDADRMLRSVEDAVAKGNLSAGVTIGQKLIKKHTKHLKNAPDASLTELLSIHRSAFVYLSGNRKNCNRMIIEGASGIPRKKRDAVLALFGDSEMPIKAMYQGKRKPTKRKAPLDAHWSQMADAFYDAGGSDAELDAMEELSVNSRVLCKGMIRLFEVMEKARFKGADRIRAEYISDMYSG